MKNIEIALKKKILQNNESSFGSISNNIIWQFEKHNKKQNTRDIANWT